MWAHPFHGPLHRSFHPHWTMQLSSQTSLLKTSRPGATAKTFVRFLHWISHFSNTDRPYHRWMPAPRSHKELYSQSQSTKQKTFTIQQIKTNQYKYIKKGVLVQASWVQGRATNEVQRISCKGEVYHRRWMTQSHTTRRMLPSKCICGFHRLWSSLTSFQNKTGFTRNVPHQFDQFSGPRWSGKLYISLQDARPKNIAKGACAVLHSRGPKTFLLKEHWQIIWTPFWSNCNAGVVPPKPQWRVAGLNSGQLLHGTIWHAPAGAGNRLTADSSTNCFKRHHASNRST